MVPTMILSGHDDLIASVAFSPDGSLIAAASDDRTAWLWDVATGAAVRTLVGHGGWVYGAAFSPDGLML